MGKASLIIPAVLFASAFILSSCGKDEIPPPHVSVAVGPDSALFAKKSLEGVAITLIADILTVRNSRDLSGGSDPSEEYINEFDRNHVTANAGGKYFVGAQRVSIDAGGKRVWKLRNISLWKSGFLEPLDEIVEAELTSFVETPIEKINCKIDMDWTTAERPVAARLPDLSIRTVAHPILSPYLVMHLRISQLNAKNPVKCPLLEDGLEVG